VATPTNPDPAIVDVIDEDSPRRELTTWPVRSLRGKGAGQAFLQRDRRSVDDVFGDQQ